MPWFGELAALPSGRATREEAPGPRRWRGVKPSSIPTTTRRSGRREREGDAMADASIDRRLPVRRGALCAARGAGQSAHLPLPHVPEGVRRVFRAACRSDARQVRDYTRRARDFQKLRSGRARLLRDCGTPLTIHYDWRKSHRRLARLARRAGAGRAEDPVRDRRTDAVVRYACPACRATRPTEAGRPGADGGDCRVEPPASRPRHRSMAA